MLKPRLLLRRGDGSAYLTRWGFRSKWFSVYLHKLDAPDPGTDLHDHPWPFVSIILRGGYVEQTWATATAVLRARWATGAVGMAIRPDDQFRGRYVHHSARGRWSRRYRKWPDTRINAMGLGRVHRIVSVEPDTWSLVLCGPKRTDRPANASWGFYTVDGYVDHHAYDRRGDLYAEIGADDPEYQ